MPYFVRKLQTFSNILQVIVKRIRIFGENLHCGHVDRLKSNWMCFEGENRVSVKKVLYYIPTIQLPPAPWNTKEIGKKYVS